MSFKLEGIISTIDSAASLIVFKPFATLKSSCQMTHSMFEMILGQLLPSAFEYYLMKVNEN